MKHYGGTIACIGTGPSLTLEQVDSARRKGFTLFGCNLIFNIVPDLAVLFATNMSFWLYYMAREGLPEHTAEKWTNNREAADKYRLNYIDSIDAPGLSKSPKRIYHGHSSGFCLLNLAYLMGAERIVLLGYDMKYAPDYNGADKQIGSSPRHYFGEYPSPMTHWPKVSVKNGVHVQLIEQYRSVAGLVEVVNCTPDSAIDCFPRVNIEELQ